jgi:hypothetical protein
MVTPSILSHAFVDYDYLLALYLKLSVCVCGFKTTCFRYLNLNLCCNNFMF